MTLGLAVHPEAAVELQDAVDWYDQGGKERGQTFLKAYNDTVDRCLLWPDSGVVLPGDEDVDPRDRPTQNPDQVDVHGAKIPRSSYWVIYYLEHETVSIVAVAHERRRPGYWLARISHRSA